MTRRLAVLLALTLTIPATADEALAASVKAFLNAEGAARDRHAAAILAKKPDFAAVYALLKAGRTYSADVPTGWVKLTVRCLDRVVRDHLVWVPTSYDPSAPVPLLVELHGAVSRPTLRTDDQAKNIEHRIAKIARDKGAIVLQPKGQKGAEWWSPTGAANVLAAIAQLKRRYNIDENRVWMGGFSDGASGSYYFALARPTPFAAFVPLNGSMAVAGLGLQVHLRSLANRPLYVINTGRDVLYPARQVAPFIEAARALGVKGLAYKSFEDIPHAPLYMGEERPKIWDWLTRQVREPHPKRLAWQTADPAFGRVAWLRVVALGDAKGDPAGFPDRVPMVTRTRVRVGISLDQTHAGSGCKIGTVAKGSLAVRVGLKPGDVIVELDGAAIPDLRALRGALGKKKPGDPVSIGFTRGGGEKQTVTDRFAPTKAMPAFDRSKVSGAVEATVDGNTIALKTGNVRRLELWLSPDLVDLSKPVTIVVDGTARPAKVYAPDVAVLLAGAAGDDDRTMLYGARVVVDIPAK